jgi:hypothetical protein
MAPYMIPAGTLQIVLLVKESSHKQITWVRDSASEGCVFLLRTHTSNHPHSP